MTRNMWARSGIAASLLTTALAGCSDSGGMSASPGGKRSLYERLGGEPAIRAVVDDFVGRAASDPKVNFVRKGTPQEWSATPDNVDRLKRMLVQFVGMATGGPQKYEGRSMKSVHAGMMISEAEFNALAGDLIATLKKFNVPQREIDELIAIVATTKGDIVESGMTSAAGAPRRGKCPFHQG